MNGKDFFDCNSKFCFVCRYAGRDISYFPQSIHDFPEMMSDGYSHGSFNCFTKPNEDISVSKNEPSKLLRPKHRLITLCATHWFAMQDAWVNGALLEVWTDYLWNKETERIDR